jgi:DNA-binding CsgD family transcriptional regulator
MLEQAKYMAQSIKTINAYKHWARLCTRALFPKHVLVCGYGRLHAGGVSADYIVPVDFPVNHLQEICNPAGGLESTLLRRWLNTRDVVLFDPGVHVSWPEISRTWLERFLHNNLRNAVAHGLVDVHRHVGTYFSFHRLESLPTSADICKLKLLVPILHETLVSVIEHLEAQEKCSTLCWHLLTQRETEIASWIGCGGTNEDIAQKLRVSPSTIKHHTSSILKKLNLSNRVQLAIAMARHPPGMIARGTKVL